MTPAQIMEYYSRDDIRDALFGFSKQRETVGVYRSGSFGTRPNMLAYPSDIEQMVREGVVEFHTSLERWSNPMALKQDNYQDLRIGWDLILDLDCKLFEHSKIAASVLCGALREHGISGFSVKYTGGKGFHIGIPWESIPKSVNFQPSAKQYPELARIAGLYLREFIREKLAKEILRKDSPEEIAEKTGVGLGKILTDTGINPYSVIEIDPVLISPRHLFRAPYSLNRKSFLVSLPIRPGDIMDFEKEHSSPHRIKADRGFLDSGEEDEAGPLFAEAMDWWGKRKKEERKRKSREFSVTKKVTPGMFPPCIKTISEGLSDGRKRSVLILINFLSSVKWPWQDIENFILEWNSKNKPPLQENYVRGQLRWHRNRNKQILPPNCGNEGYYASIGVCRPDDICRSIKNPVGYPLRMISSDSRKRNRGNPSGRRVKKNKNKREGKPS